MSKPEGKLELVGAVAFLILVGLVAFLFPAYALALFAPVAGWVVYRDHEKISRLEKELAGKGSETKP
ncbi:MAG: hypothetical protein JRN21_09170 [Nitrososphaerota archaeon]|nr:hypothetical protein [Nitrososphaerota archaeon]